MDPKAPPAGIRGHEHRALELVEEVQVVHQLVENQAAPALQNRKEGRKDRKAHKRERTSFRAAVHRWTNTVPSPLTHGLIAHEPYS